MTTVLKKMTTVIENPRDKKCPKCRSYKYSNQFVKKDRLLKTCSDCRERDAVARDKNKCEHGKRKIRCKECGGSSICEHGRQKSTCRECGGVSICEHGRQKSQCKECGGASICEHGRQKSQCKECDGVSFCEHGRIKNQCKECSPDPVKLTHRNMIQCTRQTDRKYKRYDPNNHIDYPFLEGLSEDFTECYWDDCETQLQYIIYRDDLATIERLDNSIGHIKSNCVLACLKCNRERKSNK
jgi:hypothetical protein